jgi:transcriptional regulator with XRE-family HTH domain
MQENFEKIMSSEDSLGKRLRITRKHKDITQEQLAQKLGFKQNSPISNIESNRISPDADTLKKIAEALDTDLHWLITGESSPTTAAAIKALKPFVYRYLSTITKKIQEAEEQCTKVRQQNTDIVMHNLASTEQVEAWLTAGQDEQKKVEDLHAEYKAVTDAINEALKQFGEKI